MDAPEEPALKPEEAPEPVTPEEPPGSPHGRLSDFAFALLVVGGYASVLAALLFFGYVTGLHTLVSLAAVGVGVGAIVAVVRTYKRIRKHGRGPFMLPAEILVFGILPAWGLAYNHTAPDTCAISSCSVGNTALRPLAEPEAFVLLGFHALLVLAYSVSRRRPEALAPVPELFVHTGLVLGIFMQSLLGLHFGKWVLAGIAFPPAFLPCLSPVLAVLFYFYELRGRLRRRGEDARRDELSNNEKSIYRKGPAQSVAQGGIHRPSLLRAFAASPVVLGVYAVLHAVWLGEAGAAVRVFTRTCDYTLSQIPLEIIPDDCHYLCTVAARGHASLVRPFRMGRRGGKPIVVNRQLAVANAFEDLLHERFPRFGRLARRTYDRLARPVCHRLRSRFVSDLVYLAMKPAEWAFYLVLLLLDPGRPEERIDRMYR